MPLPIQKVKDINMESWSVNPGNMNSIIPLLQTQPLFVLFEPNSNKKEKEAMKKIWLNSKDAGENKVEISSEMPTNDLNLLEGRGYIIKGSGNLFEITQSGKKVLKESILDEEESAFCKRASKELVSKNSFDFGDKVLVRVSHPEKFGAKYITISKKSLSKKKIKPITFESYSIKTKKANGVMKSLSDYSEEELVQVLHLAKRVIDNASKISLAAKASIPVNRIRAFTDMIMTEINTRL
jgi:hypothetical protein